MWKIISPNFYIKIKLKKRRENYGTLVIAKFHTSNSHLLEIHNSETLNTIAGLIYFFFFEETIKIKQTMFVYI